MGAMSWTLWLQFALCPVVLLTLLRMPAPYGRHGRPGWGPSLPQRRAWFWMELPALAVISLLVLASPAAGAPAAWVPLAFWTVHYGYRTFLFPALMRDSGRRFPIVLVLSAVGFNVLNGWNNAQALIADGLSGPAWPAWHFWPGVALFVAGFVLHVHADHVIRRLRADRDSRYGIPRGGMFRWVSSPHYLGEIIQWSGWALMTWSAAGLAFALFTLCNLAPRALANQRWYHQTFPGYPPERKALLPGIL